MPTIRLVRPVNHPTGRGPGNGQYALQKLLRACKPDWLEIGGELRDGEIPWFWSWQDRDIAVACDAIGRPFVLGPNVLFESSNNPCGNPAEQALCASPWCLCYFTESDWYADLIRRCIAGCNVAPISVWRYPIDPIPEGPLPVQWELLIYAKSGYSLETIRQLGAAFPHSTLIEYGHYKRDRLIQTARRSRVCIYLSDDDRGPLALAEILLTGCPAVGVPHGAPWIDEGVNGFHVQDLDNMAAVSEAVRQCETLSRERVRANAIQRFDGRETVRTVLSALEGFADASAAHAIAFGV